MTKMKKMTNCLLYFIAVIMMYSFVGACDDVSGRWYPTDVMIQTNGDGIGIMITEGHIYNILIEHSEYCSCHINVNVYDYLQYPNDYED